MIEVARHRAQLRRARRRRTRFVEPRLRAACAVLAQLQTAGVDRSAPEFQTAYARAVQLGRTLGTRILLAEPCAQCADGEKPAAAKGDA